MCEEILNGLGIQSIENDRARRLDFNFYVISSYFVHN